MCCLGLPGEVKERMDFNVWTQTSSMGVAPYIVSHLVLLRPQMTAMIDLISADNGYSRVVSLDGRELTHPFVERRS